MSGKKKKRLKILNQMFSLQDIIRWQKMYVNRTIKCRKRLQKRSILDNLRQSVLIRQDRVLVNYNTCILTSDSGIFFLTFPMETKHYIGIALQISRLYDQFHTFRGLSSCQASLEWNL